MKKVYVLLLTMLILLSIVLFYKNFSSPVKIALIGNFEDERYSFSTSSIITGRIAEADINDKLGIKGKKTQLIVKSDDFKNPLDTIEFLKNNKIEAIITTATSEELLKLSTYLNENKIVCISVGATSSEFGKKDDYIYRMLPDDTKEVGAFSDYLKSNNLTNNIVLIYSNSNLTYKQSVEENLRKLGYTIDFYETWQDNSINYTPNNIEGMKNKTVLILASSRDTAFIVQKLSTQGITNNVFGLSWSGGENLKSYGGRLIDGFKFITSVDFHQTEGAYGELTEKLKTYGKDNGLMPKNIYEAYGILKKAYEDKYENHITLKEALDNNKTYEGLNTTVVFDEYGDISRDYYIFVVEKGEFTKLGGIAYYETTK